MSPDRQDGGDCSRSSSGETAAARYRWALWGVVIGLLCTTLLSAPFPFASFLGTQIPGLFVVPIAMPAGGLLGFGLATWRNRVATGTGVDRRSTGNDAAGPNGTD